MIALTDIERTEPFPTDWSAFRQQWDRWKSEHGAELRASSWRWPGRNFMANDILWRGDVGDRHVELSEVTFPALGERPHRTDRLIGITYSDGVGTFTPSAIGGNNLPRTWAELEIELGIAATESES